MPTQLLLAEMEMAGVRWNREYADLLWSSVEEKMTDLQNTLFRLSGKKFNLRSRTDLAKVSTPSFKNTPICIDRSTSCVILYGCENGDFSTRVNFYFKWDSLSTLQVVLWKLKTLLVSIQLKIFWKFNTKKLLI